MYRLPRSLALEFLDLVRENMIGNPCPDIPLSIQFCSVLIFMPVAVISAMLHRTRLHA